MTFLDILKEQNIHVFTYVLLLKKPIPHLKQQSFVRSRICNLDRVHQGLLIYTPRNISQNRQTLTWKIHFKDSSLIQFIIWCCISARSTAKILGFSLLGLLLWAAWAFLWHDGWVLRVNVLRGLSSSYMVSCKFNPQSPQILSSVTLYRSPFNEKHTK